MSTTKLSSLIKLLKRRLSFDGSWTEGTKSQCLQKMTEVENCLSPSDLKIKDMVDMSKEDHNTHGPDENDDKNDNDDDGIDDDGDPIGGREG